jgi:hypothetical protein
MSLTGDNKRFSVLADYCKAKPSARVLAEFPKLYERMIADRLFLPPLFVLDVLVAVSKQENAITPASFESRPSASGWRLFLETISRRALSASVGNSEHGAALIWATAQSLKARSNGLADKMSPGWTAAEYDSWLSMGADKLIRKEADVFKVNANGKLPWGGVWVYLNAEASTIGGRERIIPFSSSFRSRPTDIFLFQELPAVDEQLDELIEEHDVYRSRGYLPVSSRAGNKDPFIRRSDAGDFFERAPGPLPENVARISPSDLVLLNSGDKTSQRLKDMLKLRFAVKAIESDINQRYHSQPDPFRRSRRLEVRITLHDDRLMRPVPPVGEEGREFSQVNLYRANLVYFLHHLSQAMEGSPIECELKVFLSLGGALTMGRRLPDSFLDAARRSPRDCFEALWLVFPQLFSGVLLRKIKEVAPLAASEVEPSMTILLSLGHPAPVSTGDSETVCCADIQADPSSCTLAGRVVGFSEGSVPSEVVRRYDAPGSVSFEIVRALFGQEGAA